MKSERKKGYQVRLTAGQLARLRGRAAAVGLTPSEWIRQMIYADLPQGGSPQGMASKISDIPPTAKEPQLGRSYLGADVRLAQARQLVAGVTRKHRKLSAQELLATVRAMVEAGKSRGEILERYPEAAGVVERLEAGA